jgi:hypothetical protein
MKQGRFARVGFAFLTATGLATAGLGFSGCSNESAEQAGKTIDSAAEAAKEKATAAAETVEQAVEATKQKVGEGMEAAKETAKVL